MIKFFVASLILTSFFFFSCESSKQEDKILLQQLSDQLDKSTESIKQVSQTSLKSLDSKTFEPSMADKANLWLSKANQIRNLTLEISRYIDSLKVNVKSSKAAINNNSISKRMTTYVIEISSIDSGLTKVFQEGISSLSDFHDSHTPPSTQTNPLVALSLLSRLENKISILESDLLKYCDLKVGSTAFIFYARVPLINQNRLYLKSNEELEINIGLGYLDYPSRSKIFVANDSLTRNENGFYTYKKKVDEKAGKHQIPIRFEYYDHNFVKKVINRTVIYNVE